MIEQRKIIFKRLVLRVCTCRLRVHGCVGTDDGRIVGSDRNRRGWNETQVSRAHHPIVVRIHTQPSNTRGNRSHAHLVHSGFALGGRERDDLRSRVERTVIGVIRFVVGIVHPRGIDGRIVDHLIVGQGKRVPNLAYGIVIRCSGIECIIIARVKEHR